MIAAPPFDWVPHAVTAGTLVLGGILTMLGGALTDFRARSREITSRRDQLRIQLYQEDREILHELQKAIAETQKFMFEVVLQHDANPGITHIPYGKLMTPEQAARSNELYVTTLPLYHRCRSQLVTDAIKIYMDGIAEIQRTTEYSEIRAKWDRMLKPWLNAQQAIGMELRRDPSEDLGVPLRRLRRRKDRRQKDARDRLDTGPVDNS